ncbi:MAG: succinate dehydrogenase, partial [Simkaniaceae bacterium]|nr:succinate dehydrogenase [Simkaniaceae bacterium]
MSSNALKLHSAFIWRRVHSLFGLWLVVFLLEHLLTNSQAALMFGESGMGFVRAVNFLKNLPYLHVLEICLLGVPLFVHMAWGIKYLLTSRQNTLPSDGSKPSLPKYSRNLAYSLQRITSWVVLFGIILHVGYMRFYRYPTETSFGKSASFFVRLDMDKGLYTVADRLGVRLYNSQDIAEERAQIKNLEEESLQLQEKARQTYSELGENIHYQENIASILEENQDLYFKKKWLEGLTKRSIGKGQV